MVTHSSILAWRIPWTEEPGWGYSPWGHKELDITEYTHTHRELSGGHGLEITAWSLPLPSKSLVTTPEAPKMRLLMAAGGWMKNATQPMISSHLAKHPPI